MTADTITIERIKKLETLTEMALFAIRDILRDAPSPEDAASMINDCVTNLVNANS